MIGRFVHQSVTSLSAHVTEASRARFNAIWLFFLGIMGSRLCFAMCVSGKQLIRARGLKLGLGPELDQGWIDAEGVSRELDIPGLNPPSRAHREAHPGNRAQCTPQRELLRNEVFALHARPTTEVKDDIHTETQHADRDLPEQGFNPIVCDVGHLSHFGAKERGDPLIGRQP